MGDNAGCLSLCGEQRRSAATHQQVFAWVRSWSQRLGTAASLPNTTRTVHPVGVRPPALARHCCFLAMWLGASQRVLSAHWLPSVVRSSSGQSITVRAECLFVLHDGTPSRHKIWLTGRHCWTVCHARLCYQEDWYLRKMHTCTLLVNFCRIIGPTGSIMNKLTYYNGLVYDKTEYTFTSTH